MKPDWLRGIAEAEGFEWDAGNVTKNLMEHQVRCEEAEEVLKNRPWLLLDDPVHSAAEPRIKAFGRTDSGRRLTLSVALRGRRLRVISARAMHRKERVFYEQNES